MIPTCFAPISVQQKSQFFRLWKRFHKRKNWLFSGGPRGAEASVFMYSLIETARASGWEPKALFANTL